MGVFKFVIGDNKKSYQVEKDQKDCPVLGKKIGDVLLGDFLGLSNYELQITGGSDKDGFPMRRDIDGTMRRRFIVTKGIGFNAETEGLRKRKMLRGNTIGTDIVQINCKISRKGEKTLEDIFGKKEVLEETKERAEEKAEKQAKDAKKEGQKEEKPKEDVKQKNEDG